MDYELDYELIKQILNKPGIIEEADLVVLKKAAKLLTDTIELHSAVSLKREICANLAEKAGLRDIKFFWDDTNCHQLTRRCPTVVDMEKLYDVLISHFKKESKPLDLFKDTPNDLVSTRYITDRLDVYNLVMSYDLKTEFPIFHSMCSKLNELDLTRGDILYITYVTFAYPLKVTIVRTYKDRVIVRRDA